MSSKRNIKSFGKTYGYLQDPALRSKKTGDALLTIDSAEFSGVDFKYLSWKNIRFVNCDFAGAYETKLDRLEKSSFENCKFVGIHGFGDMVDVKLLRCAVGGESYLKGYSGSKRLVFEQCNFVGTSADPNHWGAVGSYGEAQFISCKGKWFSVDGDIAMTMRDCEFEDIHNRSDAREVDGVFSSVLIERSKLRGTYDMRTADLQSLTIRDTQIEVLDMNNATVKGDILMERVKGGYANVYVKEARGLTVRDSQFYGNGGKFFEAYAGGIRAIEIDNVTFGGDLTSEPVTIAGGTGADLSTVRPRVNDSIIMRKSKVPRLATHHVNTALYQLQDCEIGSLDLSSSRIGQLEITGNTIARSVDFSNTQVKEGKVQSLANGQAKLDGSNIRPPH